MIDYKRWLANMLATFAGYVGAHYFRKLMESRKKKSPPCIMMAPNVSGQIHVLKEEICTLRHCSYRGLSWLLEKIDGAESQIDVMMYFLTYPAFTNAFLRAKERGVRVRFILQFDRSDEGSEWVRLRRARIPIRMMDVPPSQLMHAKMLVIDQSFVIIGSMNFTFSGLTENYEEITILDDDNSVRHCREYFNRNWDLMSKHDQFIVDCKKGALRSNQGNTGR